MIFIKSPGFVSSISYISPNRGRPSLHESQLVFFLEWMGGAVILKHFLISEKQVNISTLPNHPLSVALGMTATQHPNTTEKYHTLCRVSHYIPPQTPCCLQLRKRCADSFSELVFMAEKLHPEPYITKWNEKREMQWCESRCRWTLRVVETLPLERQITLIHSSAWWTSLALPGTC